MINTYFAHADYAQKQSLDNLILKILSTILWSLWANDKVSVKSVSEELTTVLPLPQVGTDNVLTSVCPFVKRITQKVTSGFSSNLGNRITDQIRLNFGRSWLGLEHMLFPSNDTVAEVCAPWVPSTTVEHSVKQDDKYDGKRIRRRITVYHAEITYTKSRPHKSLTIWINYYFPLYEDRFSNK